MGLTLKVAPATEPVTLVEAKGHCKVDLSDDDTLITGLISTARKQAEQRTGRALITQQWELTQETFFDAWRSRCVVSPDSIVSGRYPARIYLPKPKLQSVQSVKYLDENGVQQTLVSTEYQVVTSELVGYIQPAYGKCWPSCRVQPDSVVVAYTAGYGTALSTEEQSIKSWMLMAISTLYNQRDAVIAGAVNELPHDFFAGLLDPHVVPSV